MNHLKNSVFALGCLLVLFANQALAKEWAFDVYLDKSKIGTHSFVFNGQNRLTSKAKFNVKILFINAYQYDHTAIEQWQGNCLASLKADTLEDGEKINVSGAAEGGNFVVSDGEETQKLPECVMTFAYWNPTILKQNKLLNPQNADYLTTKINKIDSPTIDVRGNATQTNHYAIEGYLEGKKLLNIELWYDQNNDWVGLKSITPEGYQINYKRK